MVCSELSDQVLITFPLQVDTPCLPFHMQQSSDYPLGSFLWGFLILVLWKDTEAWVPLS
jgi:hypothetical protein